MEWTEVALCGAKVSGDVHVDGGSPLVRIWSRSGWDKKGGARWT